MGRGRSSAANNGGLDDDQEQLVPSSCGRGSENESVGASAAGAAAAGPGPSSLAGGLPTATVTRKLLTQRSNHIKSSIARYGMSWRETLAFYSGDIFHTLLNMPRWRFISLFFAVYIVEYVLFALVYMWQPDHCTEATTFAAALWFSVQTAATIGYGSPLAPNPSCTLVNVCVMFQVISSSLVDYALMGLMFSRFSAPSKRSSSLRFSKSAVLQPHKPTGCWALTLRLANLRKHVILSPQVQLLLARPENPGHSAYEFEELAIENMVSAFANVRLGLAVTLTHVIRPGTPLWGLSLEELAEQDGEIMLFFEGVDAMTSNSVQARTSYHPVRDVAVNSRFSTLWMVNRRNRLGLDLSEFDVTISLAPGEDSSVLRRLKLGNSGARVELRAQERADVAQEREQAHERRQQHQQQHQQQQRMGSPLQQQHQQQQQQQQQHLHCRDEYHGVELT